MRYARHFLPLALALGLAACTDERAAYQSADGQTITIIREQKFPWDKSVDFSIVVERLPNCLRRHSIGKGSLQTVVELGQYYADAFIVKIDGRLYAVATTAEASDEEKKANKDAIGNCNKLEQLSSAPADGLGEPRGVFRDQNGQFTFVPQGAKPTKADGK